MALKYKYVLTCPSRNTAVRVIDDPDTTEGYVTHDLMLLNFLIDNVGVPLLLVRLDINAAIDARFEQYDMAKIVREGKRLA